MNTQPILTTQNIKKSFGDIEAVRGVNLTVFSGEAFGLLGPNGAGKTTIIGMTLGLLQPTAGSLTIFGETLNGSSNHLDLFRASDCHLTLFRLPGSQAPIDIFTQQFARFSPVRLVQITGPQVGGTNRIGFIDHQFTALVKDIGSKTDHKCQQESQQSKGGSDNRADS